MQTISEIQGLLAERKRHRSTFSVPADSLRLDDSGHLLVNGGAFILCDDARETLVARADIPPAFFGKCDAEVQKYLFNRMYPRALRGKAADHHVGIILEDDAAVVGIVNPDLACLSGHEVLEAALRARPEHVDKSQLEVSQFQLNGALHVSFVSRSLQTEPRVGDIVRAGIDIHHSDTGASATRIESYLQRLACQNGMLAKVCTHTAQSGSRIRRAAADNREQTLRRVAEMAHKAWNELHAKMEAIRLLAEERVDNCAALIEAIAVKLRFPAWLVGELRDALGADELPPSETLWDIVNAFSRFGTHRTDLSIETRRYLQGLSGALISERIERCPSCGCVRGVHMRYLPRR